MKSMNDDNSNTNWLGFSLSPHHQMKMEAPNTTNNNNDNSNSNNHHHHHHETSFFHSPPPQLSSIYFGGGVENDQDGAALFSSPRPVIPLKPDGSLCIMEALSRSHPPPRQGTTTMVTGSTPKLEDFFGGAIMGTHHHHHHHQYETNDSSSSSREAMALSLDSLYQYYQTHEPNNQQIEFQHFPYYNNSGFRSHEMLLSMEEPKQAALQLPAVGEDEINGMKSWISRNFQMNNNGMVDNGSEYNISAMSYGDLRSLSLSMSSGSQSSCVTGSHQQQISPAAVTDCGAAIEISKKRGPEKVEQKQIVRRKSIDTFGQRTSQYRGVTRHRWTGRYEAHLWDNSCKKEGQSRKGRQGGYDMEEKAARSYDLAALKYWGPSTHINFALENYQKEIEGMKNMTRQEYVAHLRRKSSGFSRGASMYRGVTRHHQHGRWQARIGRVAGNKDLYLGTFSAQEEAAEAYDIAAIKFRGVSAVTNFDITRYDVERIMASNTLLAGELARRNKDTASTGNEATTNHNPSVNVHTDNVEIPSRKCNDNEPDWKMALYQSSQQLDQKASNVTDNYKTQGFSLVPESFIGIGTLTSVHQQEVEDSAKMVTTTTTTHMSNDSSLVTSLGSSREGSPDHRANLPMLFAMPPSVSSKLLTSSTSNVSSWFQSPQLKPNAVSLPHMPVFAAWADA